MRERVDTSEDAESDAEDSSTSGVEEVLALRKRACIVRRNAMSALDDECGVAATATMAQQIVAAEKQGVNLEED
jgi:hypothetical protein